MRNKVILPTDLVFRIAHELKRQGKVVGLTHGAFDLFHSSHLDLLLKSAKMCDYLIVGVDSDESIANYKSYFRPIISQESRLKIISELNCVDAVFIKEKNLLTLDRLRDLYKEISPNFITYGSQYGAEDLTRYATRNTSIKAKKVDTIQNYTTTQIINRIIDLHKKQFQSESKRRAKESSH